MFSIAREVVKGMQKPRAGRIRIGVSEELAETVFQHSKKVEKATSIYVKHFPSINQKRCVRIAKTHDIAEYKERDYTPGEIPDEEKHKRERDVILDLQTKMRGDREILDLWLEYEEGETQEAKIVKQLDKLDAAIQAIEYEKLGYNTEEFYPYALSQLTDSVLINIITILLKREYPNIDTYKQYFLLLEYQGDEKIFHEKMKNLS